MRFQIQTLQLLSGPERSNYTGTVVEILESLDGRLSVRHEGSIIAAHSGIAQKRPRESRKSSFFPLRRPQLGRGLENNSPTAGLRGRR